MPDSFMHLSLDRKAWPNCCGCQCHVAERKKPLELDRRRSQPRPSELQSEWCGGTYQERRNGSLSLLKTLMMRLSLVTASICGPGNWLLIRIPCNAMQTNPIHHSELHLRCAAREPTDRRRRDDDGERENHARAQVVVNAAASAPAA
jgi:hypothetical protein